MSDTKMEELMRKVSKKKENSYELRLRKLQSEYG